MLLLESGAETTQNKLTMTDIRRFIFDRLNTGRTKLNPQEIRNALNLGEFNKAIIDLTRNGLFTEIFDIPPYIEANPTDYYENTKRQRNTLYSSMADCQLVLRYFALKDEKNIRGSMKSMLDRAMELRVTNEQAEALKSQFIDRLTFLHSLFAGRPFLLPPDEKGRERISAAIYDASMVAMDQLWPEREKIRANAEGVRQRMAHAMEDEGNLEVLTGQGNTANSVKDRIALMKSVLSPVDCH